MSLLKGNKVDNLNQKIGYEYKFNFHSFHEMDGKIYIDLSISRNGQLGCPFMNIGLTFIHFMKWTAEYI